MLSKTKKKKNNFLYSLPVVIVLFFLIVVSGRATMSAFEKYSDSRGKRLEAERELSEIDARYDDLQKKVDYLETDKGVEDAIRTKFNVAKDGEKVFVIVDNSKSSSTKSVENKGFFSNIWNWALDLF